MDYLRHGLKEEPIEYHGYTIELFTHEAPGGDWKGSYRIWRDGIDLTGACLGNVFTSRGDALVNASRLAKDQVDILAAK